MNKSITIHITVALIIVALFVGLNVDYLKKQTVATIDGEKITKSELYDSMFAENGQKALSNLISEKIVEMEARKNNIVVTPEEIQAKMVEYEASFGGRDSLISILEANGMSIEDLEKNIGMTIKITKLISPQITVSDEEIAKYFKENKATLAAEGTEAVLADCKEDIVKIITEQKVETEFSNWLQQRTLEHDIVNSI